MALRDVLVFFGVEVDQTPLDQAQKKTDRLLDTFRGGARVLQAFAAGLVGHALTRFVTETVKAADDVGDFAARLGVTTDQFQLLRALADDVGAGVGTVQTSFRTLAAQMKDGAKEFDKLGVSTRGADGNLRSVEDIFWDVGTALGSTEDQATRLQLAQKLLGRGALELLPAFAGGAEAVAKYRAELASTAVVFDEDFIEAADATAKSLDRLNRRWERIKVLVVSQILPAFDWLVRKVEAVVVVVSDLIKSGQALQAMLAVGVAFLLRWAAGFELVAANLGSLVGWLLRAGAAARLLFRFLMRFALPVLVIDELITLFRGGDTLIGRFIDKLFGIGKAAAFVESVTGAAKSLLDTLALIFNPGGVEDWEMAFLKASEGIGAAFDAMFDGLFGVARDFAEFFSLVVGQAVDWVVEKIKNLPGGEWLVEQAKKLGERASSNDAEVSRTARAAIAGASALPVVPSIAPPPALSPQQSAAAAVGGQFGPPVASQVTNNITVEGTATPAVAREIAARAGAATSAAMGRDRAAIGASVGVGS